MIAYVNNTSEGLNFNSLVESTLIKIFKDYSFSLRSLVISFLNEDELLEINQKYLNHDYFTDVITFNMSDDSFVEGEIFISIDRAKEFNSENWLLEVYRYMIHGCLHLVGFSDGEVALKDEMRNLEDYYLNQIVSRGTLT